MPLNTKKIREWIASDCGSVSEAARRLGMTQPNLHNVLNGRNDDLRISTLERIADAMGVEPADLIRRAVIA